MAGIVPASFPSFLAPPGKRASVRPHYLLAMTAPPHGWLFRRSAPTWRALSAVVLAGMIQPAPAVETWTGVAGNWSTNANWLDGSAPPVGGDPALEIEFGSGAAAAVTSVLDLGVFSLHKLGFRGRAASSFQISAAPGSSLRFAGADPQIAFDGLTSATVTSPLVLASSTSITHVAGSSPAALTLSGPITDENGPQTLRIEMLPPRFDIGAVVLSGANSWTGGVDLRSGNLVAGSTSALGSAPLHVYGGSLRFTTGQVANDAVLHGNLLITGASTTTWGGVISEAVAGSGIALRGNVTLSVQGASTYTGETTLDYDLFAASGTSAPAPRLTLAGTGSLRQSSAINIHAGSRLTIAADSAGATNRLGDAAPVRLRSGQLRFSDATANPTAKTDTVGAVTLAGHSTIALAAGTASLTLNTGALQRTERGTLLVAGISTGAGVTRLFTTSAPPLVGGGAASGPQTSIVPFAIGDTGADLAGSSYLTYTAAGGFRLLSTSADYSTSLTAGATNNVRISSGTLAAAATLNSLWLTSNASIHGTAQTLMVASGAVASSGNATFRPNLAFGAAEGVITTGPGLFTMSGSVTGSNGLTKAGAGTLLFQAANAFDGPLTINAGQVRFDAADRLGTSTGAITINGTGAGLDYSGPGALTLSRPLALNTGIALMSVSSTGELTLAGGTSGPGGWQVVGSTASRIRLSGAAAHTGQTILGGRVAFDSDTALGAGDLAFLASPAPTIELTGAWSSARRIDFNASVALQTNGFNVALDGPLTGSGTITKTTPGNVRVSSTSGLRSSFLFDSGRLEIAGAGVLRPSNVTLSGGAALVLDNAAQASNDRFAGFGKVTLRSGELRLEGNATTPVVEAIDLLTLDNTGGTGSFKVAVTSPGSVGTVLQLRDIARIGTLSYPSAAPPLVVKGTALGGLAGSPFTRLVIAGAPLPAGLYRSAVLEDAAGTASFAINDTSADAAGPLGLRAPTGAEYSTAANIRNPANAGTTPTDAHLLLSGAASATGNQNTAQTLTLAAGATLTLTAAQKITLTAGGVIARSGATPARITGGTLDLGAAPFGLYLAGDLQLGSSVIAGTGVASKLGPGTLFLQSGARLPATFTAASGKVSVGDAAALRDSLISLAPLGTLELTAAADLGGLAGPGSVQLNAHTATLGTAPGDFTFNGTIGGAGALRITGGGNAEARRVLTNSNSFTGGVTLDSGVFVFGHAAAAGTGTLTANGGTVDTTLGTLVLANPVLLNATLSLPVSTTFAAGASLSGPGGLLLKSERTLVFERLADLGGSVATQTFFPSYSNSSPFGEGIYISGASGSVRAGGGIRLQANNFLFLPESTAYSGAGNGRLGDDTLVELSSARLLVGSQFGPVTNISETFGALRVSGYSALALTPISSGSLSLSAGSLQRVGRGTLEIQGTGSVGVPGAASSFIRFTTPPATTDGGVVPYAVATLDGFSDIYGVVVHDPANGLRLLANAEYTTSIAAATPASHLLVTNTGNLSNAGALTVRSLHLGATVNSLIGGGSLTLASGLLISSGS
jgi:fibronectin-binding autotransporter adhesin